MATTIEQFIASAGITATIKPAERNPHIDADDWALDASHWSVWLRCGRSRMHTYFSMGSAHTEPPKLRDVLDGLASDAASFPLDWDTDEAFAGWCSDYGYSTDSRKAYRTYRIIAAQTERLKRLLGSSALNTLCCEVDRL